MVANNTKRERNFDITEEHNMKIWWSMILGKYEIYEENLAL